MSILEVKNLHVEFDTPDGVVEAVSDVNFTLNAGHTLAIVGESGSGKSVSAFAILGLLAENARASGSVKYQGEEILNAPEAVINRYRSNEIAMIFQDPMTSLNPYMRISDQMSEVLIHHQGLKKSEAVAKSIEMLEAVKIPNAAGRIHMYPHEFSGGMRQRVMIAMALLCSPKLLIADEPTTALDVTVQAEIMDLLLDLQEDFDMAIILITHDLGIVAGTCEKTLVMYGGKVMEYRDTEALFTKPDHPYTRGLLTAVPRLDKDVEELSTIDYDALMAEIAEADNA